MNSDRPASTRGRVVVFVAQELCMCIADILLADRGRFPVNWENFLGNDLM